MVRLSSGQLYNCLSLQTLPVTVLFFDHVFSVHDAAATEIYTLSYTTLFRSDAAVVGLPQRVEAKFLFEARRSRGERCSPVRLLCLRLVQAVEPVCEVSSVGFPAGICGDL